MTSITIVFRMATGKLLLTKNGYHLLCLFPVLTCVKPQRKRQYCVLCIVFDFREGKRKCIQVADGTMPCFISNAMLYFLIFPTLMIVHYQEIG